MILLDSILNDLIWLDDGIVCSNYEQMKFVHKFLREAILDRYIYNSRVAGVAVKSTDSKMSVAKTYISKHQDIGESYAELTAQLSDKVFFTTANKVINVDLKKGVNTVSDSSFITGGSKVSCFCTNDVLCRAIKDNVILNLFVTYDCGYKSMADNSIAIKSQHTSKYFPCNTDYSLAQYVRVLPPTNGTKINIRYYNGMTPEYFKIILSNWNKVIDSGKLSKEEKQWLQMFS